MALLSSSQDILNAFHLYAGSATELSSEEELNLLQKIYTQVLGSHEWEFLKKEATGSLTTADSYIDLTTAVTDFDRFTRNNTVYIGSTNQEYPIIPFQQRRYYQNAQGFFYFDSRQNRLYLTQNLPTDNTWNFDYMYYPPALVIDAITPTNNVDPVIPKKFYDVLYHAMLVDNSIIEMSEKARAYTQENAERYNQLLQDMIMDDSRNNQYNNYGI